MKQSNIAMPEAEWEQDNVAMSEGRGGATQCGGDGMAAAIREVQALEAAAYADELLRRSASVAAAMMLQDTIVTVLTLLLELEQLAPTARDSSVFDELASQLASTAVAEAEAELPNAAILASPIGHA
jgi:hypothetical protein